MTEATISFSNPEQILVLFGPRDQYLRRIRDAVGVDVVLRGDQIHFQGNEEQVRRGMAIFADLRGKLDKDGHLADSQVDDAIDKSKYERVREREVIELFEKARRVVPRTSGQGAYVQAIRENDLVFCTGPAGCGKTYLAVAMAVHALRQEQVKKIVLVRPAVEAGEKLGFLPGDMLAKVNPFVRPLFDALHEMLDYEQVARYIEKDVIEVVPLAFMRGRTLSNTFIILDEGQNTTITQMKMFLTRMGTGSRIVATGDTTQIDLPPNVPSGLIDAIERLSFITGVATVRLSERDIVRHPLVKEIVKAYDSIDAAHKHQAKRLG